jgi:NADPH2:quinone reductase
MRAFTLADFGATPSLTDADVPEPEEGEIRVRVRAASVNGFDLAVMSGYTKAFMDHRFPLVIGKDFAGEVDAVALGVSGFAPGDRVFGVVTKPFLREGSYAEYTTVPVSVGVARLPDSVPFAEGAALGLAGSAAHVELAAAELGPGQTALVIGATGGVGTQLVQMAKAAGARVLATGGTDEERAHVSGLGADDVLEPGDDLADRTRALVPEGVDVAFHMAGDPSSVAAVRDGGRFVSLLLAGVDLGVDNVEVHSVYADPTPALLDRIAADHSGGTTKLTIQEVFPLDRVEDALDAFRAGTIGKVVISID